MITTETLELYEELKAQYGAYVLLFRCGDNYACFADDAQSVAETLALPILRLQGTGTRYTEFPYHALDTYLPRLIRHGLRLAICEDLEKPQERGGITETITPNRQAI